MLSFESMDNEQYFPTIPSMSMAMVTHVPLLSVVYINELPVKL